MRAAILAAALALALGVFTAAYSGGANPTPTTVPNERREQTTLPTKTDAADAAAPTGAQPTEPEPTGQTERTDVGGTTPDPSAPAATPASMAQRPQPTYTVADLAPGTQLPSLFGPNLTDEERNCMLPELRDGRMATNVLNSKAQVLTPTQERILRETFRCLKQENLN